jgi:hypothetical protein
MKQYLARQMLSIRNEKLSLCGARRSMESIEKLRVLVVLEHTRVVQRVETLHYERACAWKQEYGN